MGNTFTNITYNKGWGSLKDLQNTDLYPSFSNIGDLVKKVVFIYVGEDRLNQYEELTPFYKPLSYPEGKCISFEFKRNDSVPLEIGILLNKTTMKQNNISDVDVLFKDPNNSVGFLSSKVSIPSLISKSQRP